jgi:Tol biopolymer transport system component
VAVELGVYDCPNDVLVMRTDGSGLRRPFSAPDRSAFAPAWAPDGTRLAVVTAPWSATGPAADPPPSVLSVWDPSTGASTDLGRPCERCSPVGQQDGHGALAWSPDSGRIAVDYADLSCGLETPAPDAETVCRGIAVVSMDGAWAPVTIADDDPGSVPALVGWLDDSALLVQDGEALIRVDAASGDLTPLPSSVSGWMWPVSRALSPDRTLVLSVRGGNEAFMTAQDVLTGATERIEPVPPDVLDFAWSPDSKWVIAQADTDGFGANRGLYLGPVDGSRLAAQVLAGGFGNMAWLQAH